MRLETLSREDSHTRGPRGGRAASEGIEAKRAKIYKIFIPALLVCALGFSCRRAAAYAHRRRGMDAVYLLILAGLYAVTHGLIWALHRLSKTS